MEENLFEQRVDLSGLNKAAYAIRSEIGRVIVGQHKMVDLLLIGLLCDGHILIEGVPGVAKTLTAKLIAKIIDVDFSRLQFMFLQHRVHLQLKYARRIKGQSARDQPFYIAR